MNWIKKTIIFIGLTLVFAFVFSANKTNVEKIQIEKNDSAFSVQSNHSLVFIQPQASNGLTFAQKTTDFSVVKYFDNYLAVILDLKTSIPFTAFANQDINRCEMVSILLFPFHYFW